MQNSINNKYSIGWNYDYKPEYRKWNKRKFKMFYRGIFARIINFFR